MDDRARCIRVVITDIDGVWTDGGMYYGPDGCVMKRFNTRDGAGVAMLRELGIETVIVTREDSEIARARALKLGITQCHCGVADKAALLDAICERARCAPEEAAYIGDDVYDIALLQAVGFSACPSDAVEAVKKIVHYVGQVEGGSGAFRELVDVIIRSRNSVEDH